MGLDLGGRRALGLCRISLWPLGRSRRHVGLGARSGGGAGGLCTCAGRLPRRQQFSDNTLARPGRRCRLVSACTARCVSAVLCREPWLFPQHQPQQYGDQHDHDHQRLQHHNCQQNHQRDQNRLCQSAGARRSCRGADDRVRARAARGKGSSAGVERRDRECPGLGGRSSGSGTAKCAWRRGCGHQAARH